MARNTKLTPMANLRRLDDAQRLLEQGQATEALSTLQGAEGASCQGDWRWCHLMSATLLAHGRLKDCVSFGRKALALREHASTRVNVGAALIMGGAFQEAIDILSAIRGPDAGVLMLLSEPLIRLGRLHDAAKTLSVAAGFDSEEGRAAKTRLERLTAARRAQQDDEPRWACGHRKGRGESRCWDCTMKSRKGNSR